MVELSLNSVTKQYGSETAVDDLSVTTDGDLLVLLGPSGCGKSTTLRMIAGLEQPTSGTIEIGGHDVTGTRPSDRSIAMVFQNYALYTTMNVAENIGYGLKHSTSLSREERQAKVEEIAEMFGIKPLLDRTIDELSGGQKQRVALGRALVRDPDVFLLDEPLSSLDAKLRSRMRTELQRIQEDLGVTTVYVTHDQKEAMTMGDEILILNDGVKQQVGPPEQTYTAPANRFVADFLGSPSMNLIDVTLTNTDNGTVCQANGTQLATLPSEKVDRAEATLGIRPEDISLVPDPDQAPLTGVVEVTEYQGNDNFVDVSVNGHTITVVVPAVIRPDTGTEVGITLPSSKLHLFAPSTGETVRSPSVSTDQRETEVV